MRRRVGLTGVSMLLLAAAFASAAQPTPRRVLKKSPCASRGER
jgi:hypothetical protein